MPLTVLHAITADFTTGFAVVRDPDAAARLQHQILERNASRLGGEVLTLGALRSRVAAAAKVSAGPTSGPIGTRIGLRTAFTDCDLSAFGGSVRAPGFLSSIERALSELREAGVRPNESHALASDPTGRSVFAMAYAARAVPFPVDWRWDVARAAERLTVFPPVTVLGFDDVSPPDWALFRTLGRVTDVVVVTPYAEGRRAFDARHARQARWMAEADRVERPEDPSATDLALRSLSDTLFEDVEPPRDAANEPMRLVGGSGTRGMQRLAFQEALRAHQEGAELSECAVVVPRLADARDDLERLTAEWGIPARRVTRRRVVETPIGVALLALLRLGELDAAAPGALDELLRWLRSPYSGADPEEVDRFEVDARRAGLEERRELIGRWDGEAITPARRLVAAARAGVAAQIAAMVEVGWQGLRRAAAGGRLPTTADVLDRAALAVLSGAGADLDYDSEMEPSVERPRGPLPPGELGQVLADLTIRDEAGPHDGLQLHDYASIRGRQFKVVILCGLDSDGFPGRPAPDPILGALREALGDLLPPRAPGTSESRLRFWHAVNAATERLVLVRRLVDDEGRELAPSPYWVETCRVIGRDIDDLDRRTGARGEILDDGEVVPSEAEVLRRLAVSGQVTAGPLADAAGRRVRRLGVAPDAFIDVDAMRVTDLETFLRCPYGWLIDRYVHPRELERPFDAAAEGTLAHEVMQRVYTAMRDNGVGPCTEATLRDYVAELERVLPAVDLEFRPRRAAASFDAFIKRLDVYLRLVLAREAALGVRMRPHEFERKLGDGELLGVSPAIHLSGTVDRIDMDDDGNLVVIDYKRSGARLKADGAVLERLQLPLYGLLASLSIGGKARPAGGFYVGLLKDERDGAVREDVVYADGVPPKQRYPVTEWERLVEEAREAAMSVARDIRAGRLLAPPTKPCPPWCGCGVLWR